MKKIVLSLFLAFSFMLSAFVGVACGENTSSSSESSFESSVVQSESVTDSTESSVESLEESTASSVESSVEPADSSVEITGTPIEYELLDFNGMIPWNGAQTPKVVTSKEEILTLQDNCGQITWFGEPFSETLPEDYFEEKAIVFYFYCWSCGSNIEREVQNVFLDKNTIIIHLQETLYGNAVDHMTGCTVLCIEIDKKYVEQIEEITLKVTSQIITN